MRQLYKTASFDIPHASESNKLQRVLSSTIQNRSRDSAIAAASLSRYPHSPLSLPHPTEESACYWNAKHFNLQRAQLFQQATPQEQNAILQIASLSLLQEAYFIEKAGISYMAKMVALSESTDERMLYALFSADETYHLTQLLRFLPLHQTTVTDDPFLRFLTDLIEHQDKTVLLFILQVVLKGWVLSHYRTLASDCQNPELANILTGFLQDESRHHTTGITLFKQNPLTPETRQVIVEALVYFLRRVQTEPQSVVAAVNRVLGPLSRCQKIQLIEELQTEIHTGTRLNLLRSLIGKETAHTILNELEARQAFEPLPAYLCA
ncbi:ferritin-like domain-containing protein [Oscillatoria sp. FACHB-1406]|uniref:ferritin-like domain-containing protein n=1 Tax=Oscillatoria sp. FACHB-1406 TaxID=2692846 RepID=UPI00168284E7|nr:ferritin-like domain-containing protein [Oscillatoria sp. FACHB-1406]MBD2579497.1 ferritin-like domain-containing protein [Oscillatoria sp. FACHB-1406]